MNRTKNMNRGQRDALLARLIKEMRERGSWCGETHLQKAVYFLQTLLKVPLDFEFIFFIYGPFSFDLRDELTGMRADSYLKLEPQKGYGPKINIAPRSRLLEETYPKTLRKYENKIRFVAEKLGKRSASELERLATALYVTERESEASPEQRAKKLTELKPHISETQAREAVQEIDLLINEAKTLTSN